MARELPYNGRKAYELSKEADAILARAGTDMWGNQPAKTVISKGNSREGCRKVLLAGAETSRQS
jgi:hypothetical protein